MYAADVAVFGFYTDLRSHPAVYYYISGSTGARNLSIEWQAENISEIRGGVVHFILTFFEAMPGSFRLTYVQIDSKEVDVTIGAQNRQNGNRSPLHAPLHNIRY